MPQVPIEIIIPDQENVDSVKKAIEVLQGIQNTFKYSILNEIELEHKIYSESRVHKKDLYDFLDKYKSTLRGYHPHFLCIVNKYLIGDKYSNLFASLERKDGILTGNGIITSYGIKSIIGDVPMPIYFMFYLLTHPLRFLIREKIGHKEARICIYDTKVNKFDINKILKYGSFCLECHDKIRSVLSISEMKSVREVLGFISDVANSNNPEKFFTENSQNYDKLENKVSNQHEFEETIKLLTQSRIEEAFDKVSLIIKKNHSNYYKQVILLFSRLNKLKLEKRNGIISRENELLETNKINLALIEIISEIKKHDNEQRIP